MLGSAMSLKEQRISAKGAGPLRNGGIFQRDSLLLERPIDYIDSITVGVPDRDIARRVSITVQSPVA